MAIRKHLRLLIALPLGLALAACVVSLVRSRTYVARAAFVPAEPSNSTGSLGALVNSLGAFGIPSLSALAGGLGGASVSPQFYGDLLTSNTLLHAVVTTQYGASHPGENGGKPFTGTLVEYLKAVGPTPADRELDAMKKMKRDVLSVLVDRPTGIVHLEVRSRNRLLSALVARRMLELVNEFNLRRRQTQAGAEREFDARRTAAALDSLHAAEQALATFRSSNIDFSHSPALVTHESELQRRVTLAQQLYTTIAQRYEVANIEAVRNTPVVTVLDAPEGLVEARPRYVAFFTVGAFAAGLIIACGIALVAERHPAVQ
jgi:uncharacterized protein involved in exopolysaccharide biosynthesis